MVNLPSQKLKWDFIGGGTNKIKIWKIIVFYIYPQIKSAHNGYQNQ